MKFTILILPIFFMFAGCSHKATDQLKEISYGQYQKVSYDQIPSWKDENFDEALAIFKKTCAKTSHQTLFKSVCHICVNAKDAKVFFEENFTPFVSLSSSSLATGYYEPTIKGSSIQSKAYPYPLYGVPDDLIPIEVLDEYKPFIKRPMRGRLFNGKVVPYYSRKEISENALASQSPLCYVSDKVELFFLQVQGSGRIIMDDNSSMYVGYAEHNGYTYHSIGKEMVARGYLKSAEVSLQSIHDYFDDHPEAIDTVLNSNPSYIFFKKRDNSAIGALGIPLEEGRSVAVDRENIPLGMPLFISTEKPLSKERLVRVMFAHDTGAAIKGENRIDIFFGSTQRAEEEAGMMQAELKLWMLVPNDYLVQSKQRVK